MYLNIIRPIGKILLPKSLRPFFVSIYFGLRGFFYRGKEVYCPCCERSYRKFLPYGIIGEKPRDDAQCPKCGSVERHRMLWLYLKKNLENHDVQLKILHIAPENILQSKMKHMKNIEYVSADIDSPLAMVKMDITDIDSADNSFDVILCSHVLEYVFDDMKALAEFKRILKPEGYAILQSKIEQNRDKTFEDREADTSQKKMDVFGQPDLHRIYGKDFIDRLQSSGFEICVEKYGDILSLKDRNKFGIKSGEYIYKCIKPAWQV
jgi:SAM-dependent methyltransferase